MKTYSTKANARRALKAIGDRALAAADILIKEVDGQFGFNKEEAEGLMEEHIEVVAQHLADTHAEQTGRLGDDAVLLDEFEGQEVEMDPLDREFVERCGFAHCPKCGVHLENGLLNFSDVVSSLGDEQKAFEAQQKEWSCMGCGAGFGEDIVIGPANEAAPKLNKSTANRPCTLVWEIADAMPGAKRKEVIEACVKAGVAYYTARTQYQQWKSLQPK